MVDEEPRVLIVESDGERDCPLCGRPMKLAKDPHREEGELWVCYSDDHPGRTGYRLA